MRKYSSNKMIYLLNNHILDSLLKQMELYDYINLRVFLITFFRDRKTMDGIFLIVDVEDSMKPMLTMGCV